MKISVAQLRPFKGDISQNIEKHKFFINTAISMNSDAIFFPELSLSGYEPTLAKNLAVDPNEKILDVFEEISNNNKIHIGLGLPIKAQGKPKISMLIFQPGMERQIYSKYYLHPDEEEFFSNEDTKRFISINTSKIAIAICYELSIPEHAEFAFKNGASVYIASVSKTKDGSEKACQHLSTIARQYSMTTLMSNSIGPSDNFQSAGQTSAWNKNGKLLNQIQDKLEGILTVDTQTQQCENKILNQEKQTD